MSSPAYLQSNNEFPALFQANNAARGTEENGIEIALSGFTEIKSTLFFNKIGSETKLQYRVTFVAQPISSAIYDLTKKGSSLMLFFFFFSEKICPAYFDNISCWPDTPAGSVATLLCPKHVNGFTNYVSNMQNNSRFPSVSHDGFI